jgi:hypothetical protein
MKQLLIFAAILSIVTSAQSPAGVADDAVASRSGLPDISTELKLPKVFAKDLGAMLAMSDLPNAGGFITQAGNG